MRPLPADYINGDTYYKIKYPENNLIRARNQWRLYQCACDNMAAMERIVQ